MNMKLNDAVEEQYHNKRVFLTVVVGIAIYLAFVWLSSTHDPSESWGILSLLPTMLVLIVAIISRRPFESMIAGCVAGLVMLNPFDLVSPFADNISAVLGNETIIWIVLVCGLMGGLIQLLEISGCLNGFSEWLKKIIKSRRQSLLATFALGVVVFIDDYLNCLAVSTSVKKLTDTYGVSREKLAYIVDSTAAPMCVIVPISTWAVYFSGLLEENGVAADGGGIGLYISSIPYMAYAWFALLIVFLVAYGILGDWGPMKRAEKRAKEGNPVPEDFVDEQLVSNVKAKRTLSFKANIFNFAFPMILLIVSTIYFEVDLLRGALLTCFVTVAVYWAQGILSFETQVESIFTGFKVMLYPLSTVIGGFFLKAINDELGMTMYVIDAISPHMTVIIFPAVIFAVMAFLTFATASSWGLYVLAMPIVFPVAAALGVSTPLVIGALLSASSFGSHACFFSDSSLLAAQGAGCSPMQHAFTQFPYALLGAVLSVAAFLGLGFMMA
ncbi:MAG: Na+/H+ antiporter NhaC family protein [Psychrobacter sp.]|uniref:Na+/H+ antiporter NhaC family protein n=1 Tax=unclassified Psychrobacter TaxID=196806 RepID=UPI001787CDBF|nr:MULTISPECIES: Na+/H+ antiporter NhaC family protein [unclassified Psychrobacter]MBE0441457.1 sodium:proton antiporter [Psychrobacter sp. FME13]